LMDIFLDFEDSLAISVQPAAVSHVA
jgi:hypothetical protein